MPLGASSKNRPDRVPRTKTSSSSQPNNAEGANAKIDPERSGNTQNKQGPQKPAKSDISFGSKLLKKFLDLPTELRLEIYKRALPSRTIEMRMSENEDPHHPEHTQYDFYCADTPPHIAFVGGFRQDLLGGSGAAVYQLIFDDFSCQKQTWFAKDFDNLHVHKASDCLQLYNIFKSLPLPSTDNIANLSVSIEFMEGVNSWLEGPSKIRDPVTPLTRKHSLRSFFFFHRRKLDLNDSSDSDEDSIASNEQLNDTGEEESYDSDECEEESDEAAEEPYASDEDSDEENDDARDEEHYTGIVVEKLTPILSFFRRLKNVEFLHVVEDESEEQVFKNVHRGACVHVPGSRFCFPREDTINLRAECPFESHGHPKFPVQDTLRSAANWATKFEDEDTRRIEAAKEINELKRLLRAAQKEQGLEPGDLKLEDEQPATVPTITCRFAHIPSRPGNNIIPWAGDGARTWESPGADRCCWLDHTGR